MPEPTDPRYVEHREKVVQLLKNRNDFLALHCRDTDNPSPPAEDPGDPWPLNVETMKRWSDSASGRSLRALERELSVLKRVTPSVYNFLYTVFLHPEAGDADYDRLKARTDNPALSRKARKEASIQLTLLDASIYALTVRLLDERLYVIFPWRYYSRGSRGKSMEEGYRELHGVFRAECDRLRATRKHYRSKAYETSAKICEVSVPTMERAVRFVEGGVDAA